MVVALINVDVHSFLGFSDLNCLLEDPVTRKQTLK